MNKDNMTTSKKIYGCDGDFSIMCYVEYVDMQIIIAIHDLLKISFFVNMRHEFLYVI